MEGRRENLQVVQCTRSIPRGETTLPAIITSHHDSPRRPSRNATAPVNLLQSSPSGAAISVYPEYTKEYPRAPETHFLPAVSGSSEGVSL